MIDDSVNSLDGQMLQKASVDYLNQINQNVISLNASAYAQRQLSERQVYLQQNTNQLIDEQKQTMAAKIQNQAYMAYGTVQHDMKNLIGITDENTRIAMTTMRIAGGSALDDVRGVSNSLKGAASTGLAGVRNISTPGAFVEQGIFGASLAAIGLRSAPNTMFAEDYRKLSTEQLGETVRSTGYEIASWLPGFGRFSGLGEKERSLDFMGIRINRPTIVNGDWNRSATLSSEQKKIIGRSIFNIERDLTRSYEADEAKSIIQIAAQSEFNTIRNRSSSPDENLEKTMQEMRKFAQATEDLGKVFNMAGKDMAQNISDLKNLIGVDASGAKRLLLNAQSSGTSIGLTGEESINVMRRGVDVARNYGISAEAGIRRMFQTVGDIRERASVNDNFKELVFQRGGVDAMAQETLNQRRGFRLSSKGLLYQMAKESSGFNVNGSIMDIATAAAQTASSGPGAILRAAWNQINEEGGEDKWTRNFYMEMFKQLFPDAKIIDLKEGGKYRKEFLGLIKLQTNDSNPSSVKSFAANMLGESGLDVSKQAQSGSFQMQNKLTRDINKRSSNIFNRISNFFSGRFEDDISISKDNVKLMSPGSSYDSAVKEYENIYGRDYKSSLITNNARNEAIITEASGAVRPDISPDMKEDNNQNSQDIDIMRSLKEIADSARDTSRALGMLTDKAMVANQ